MYFNVACPTFFKFFFSNSLLIEMCHELMYFYMDHNIKEKYVYGTLQRGLNTNRNHLFII